MKTLNYTNRAGENVSVTVEQIAEPRHSSLIGLNSMIGVTINGNYVAGCVYTKALTDSEIKSCVSGIRKNRISRVK